VDFFWSRKDSSQNVMGKTCDRRAHVEGTAACISVKMTVTTIILQYDESVLYVLSTTFWLGCSLNLAAGFLLLSIERTSGFDLSDYRTGSFGISLIVGVWVRVLRLHALDGSNFSSSDVTCSSTNSGRGLTKVTTYGDR